MVRDPLERLFLRIAARDQADGFPATFIQILDMTLRLATPLLLACLAGLFSERPGIFDIGLEGKMLVAAFVSARRRLRNRLGLAGGW